MSTHSKINMFEAVIKEDNFLVSTKEDQQLEKESQCREEEKKLLGKERGGKIVEGDIEPPVDSTDLLDLKSLKISRSTEVGVGELLMEGKFFVEGFRKGKEVLDLKEFGVHFLDRTFKLCNASEEKNVDNFIIKLAGTNSKGGKGKSHTTAGSRPRQTMIPRPSSSTPNRGRGGGSLLTSPVKKGKFVSSGAGGSASNLYSIRIKNQNFLIVFAEDGLRQLNYSFPGSQRKAWCTAFDKDLKNESAFSHQEVSPICSIVKRRDTRESGDVQLAQRTNTTFYMSAYLCPLDEDDTAASVSNQILSKINQYAAAPRNNMKMFRYIKEITEGLENDDLHALDYWLVTRDVVSAIGSLYEEEIQDGTFYEYEGLVDGVFERSENTNDVRETMTRNM